MLRLRVMTAADIPFGMRLKEEAGWNQTAEDWARFLAMEPEGCFLAEDDNEPVGTLTTCVMGTTAWIAMVLVDVRRRGQGIGSALLSHALAYLDARGVPSIRLDATPMGKPLYEKLGFAAEYAVVRYTGIAPAGAAGKVRPYAQDDLEAVLRLDLGVAGTDRRKLVSRLLAEHPGEARVVERDGVAGYLTARPGTLATMIGPGIALDEEAGRTLVLDAWARHAGTSIFMDIPVPNAPATTLADTAGLTPQRTLLRMVRGIPVRDTAARLWASSGPEKG